MIAVYIGRIYRRQSLHGLKMKLHPHRPRSISNFLRPRPEQPSPRLSSLLLAAPQPPLYISGTSISVWQRGRFSLIAPILSFVQVSKVHAIVWYAYSIRASILRPQPFNTIRSVPVFSPTFVRRYIDTSVGGTSLTPCHFVSRLDWRLSNPRTIDRWLVNDRNR